MWGLKVIMCPMILLCGPILLCTSDVDGPSSKLCKNSVILSKSRQRTFKYDSIARPGQGSYFLFYDLRSYCSILFANFGI